MAAAPPYAGVGDAGTVTLPNSLLIGTGFTRSLCQSFNCLNPLALLFQADIRRALRNSVILLVNWSNLASMRTNR